MRGFVALFFPMLVMIFVVRDHKSMFNYIGTLQMCVFNTDKESDIERK